MDEMDPSMGGEDTLSPEEQQATLEFLSELLADSVAKHSQSLGKKYAPPPAEPEAPVADTPPAEGEGELTEEDMELLASSLGG